MQKVVGFNLIYPEGCKEITEGLKLDELKRRMTDLIKSLEETQIGKAINIDSLLNNTETNSSENTDLKMEGLLLHLTSEMFIDHEDVDVQLRVAVCICNILKLYCPNNPFLSFSDFKTRIKVVLDFLLKCLNEMTKLKSKLDKYFLNLYKIFSISCETNLFHYFISAEDGEGIFLEYVRTIFNIVGKFSDWSEDNKPAQMACDALVVLFSSHEISVPDQLVSYILNYLVDQCSNKEQKQLSVDIISRCLGKLKDQIQTILQNSLIKSEMDDDLSESSDNEEAEDFDDDFCSMPEYQMTNRKHELKLEKSKLKTQKLEKIKNTIETCFEYSCDHTFQLVYEFFKISAAIVTSLLPTIEMKLRSPNNVIDRKRACRLLGKLFITYIPSNNSSHASLWECFLGRFCDIEVEVREICVRVARDVLRRAISGDDISGILSLPSSKEDLVKALQKRSHDQEESIRYQLVLSISQIFEKSKSIIFDEELDFVNEMLFKILLDRTRDKCMIVRKEATASLGKLYRRLLTDTESHIETSRNVDFILGLGILLPGQRNRLELLLTQVLRLYLRVEVEDKIVVERLFNTFLVPYNFDLANRMKALLQIFIICDDTSLMSIEELFKTQVMIMNVLRETVHLIKDSNAEKVLSPSISQKLKEKVKRLGEYLPSKDKIENLSKFFLLVRSDEKLMDIMSKLVHTDSSRDIIIKSISEIKKHFSTTKPGVEPNPANILKKKAFFSTIKCLLERSAPIIMDSASGQELISLLVSSKVALESSKNTEDYTISISRALKLIHVISVIYRNAIPIQESYEYIASIISQFDASKMNVAVEMVQHNIFDDKQLTQSSTRSVASLNSAVFTFKGMPITIEELCLLTLTRIIGSHSPSESSMDIDEDKFSAFQDHSKTFGLFSDEAESLMALTLKVVQYLINCATNGSAYPLLFTPPQFPSNHENKDPKNLRFQADDGVHEHCTWKYNCRIAKLAARCLIGLYICCQQESHVESSVRPSNILAMLEGKLDDLVQNCSKCELFSSTQSIMLSTLSQLGLNLRRRYGVDIHSYVQNIILECILTSDNESVPAIEVVEPRNLSSWVSNNMISITTQVRIQALKMLSKWMVTLKVEEDRNLILSVMVCLRKYIGLYSNTQYSGSMTDGDMAQMRLAAGKCWLKLAQVQSFLSIFDVKWLHRLSWLIYDPCTHVRESFLKKLHKGLFRLKLSLDYMAMFAFVPLVQSPEYLTMAKNYFSANVSRRREFLERNPQYQTDAKLLFAVLPEYVLAFIIHMLAHDEHWIDVDDQISILRVKQCLWFVMEPILKMNENSSFIRKLLEKIKHAQDATDPNNSSINEKLYICCDISLGLLISKQSSYDLKEYPVELKLPRTRYLPAPNTFFNPDFANILIVDPPKVRIQFSPTHKSKQMIMNFMPAPLIKGHVVNVESNSDIKIIEENEVQIQKPIISLKPKKHVAKIVVGLPEIESEGVSGRVISPPSTIISPAKKQLNVRKIPPKRKSNRSDSPVSEMEEFETNPTSVTKRGRICKPNVRVMKDMVSLTRKPSTNNNPIIEKSEISDTVVRIEGTVSVNLERIQTIDSAAKYDYTSDHFEEGDVDLEPTKKEVIKVKPKSPVKTLVKSSTRKSRKSSTALKRVGKCSPGHKSLVKTPTPLNRLINSSTVMKRNIRKHVSNELNHESNVENNKNIEHPSSIFKDTNAKILKIILSKCIIPKQTTNKVVTVNTPKSTPKNIGDFKNRKKGGLANNTSSQNIKPNISSRKSRSNGKSVEIKEKVIDSKFAKESKKIKSKLKQIPPQKSILISTAPGRTKRSSQDTQISSDSIVLKQLTKQIITRKASSIKGVKIKHIPANILRKKSKSIILEVEQSPLKVSRRKSLTDVNGSPSTPKSSGKPKKSLEMIPKSSVEIISRSKRIASQAATDSLMKKN